MKIKAAPVPSLFLSLFISSFLLSPSCAAAATTAALAAPASLILLVTTSVPIILSCFSLQVTPILPATLVAAELFATVPFLVAYIGIIAVFLIRILFTARVIVAFFHSKCFVLIRVVVIIVLAIRLGVQETPTTTLKEALGIINNGLHDPE